MSPPSAPSLSLTKVLPQRAGTGRWGWAAVGRRMQPVAALCFLLAALLLATLAPLIVPHDPAGQSLALRLAPPAFLAGGRADYLLGSDHLGRDVLSRVIAGSRATLLVGFAGVALGTLVGSAVGLVAGYAARYVDEVLMTVADIQLAFPTTLLAIAVIAVLGPSLVNLILVVGLSGWVTYARVTRGVVLKLRSEEFVAAVRSLGGTHTRVLCRHILPNSVSVLIVLATLDLARIIVLESTLSFLGLGIQPPTPSWGGMIGEGREFLDSAWWIAVFPGAALFLTAMSVSRLGDWLRDALDPTLRTG